MATTTDNTLDTFDLKLENNGKTYRLKKLKPGEFTGVVYQVLGDNSHVIAYAKTPTANEEKNWKLFCNEAYATSDVKASSRELVYINLMQSGWASPRLGQSKDRKFRRSESPAVADRQADEGNHLEGKQALPDCKSARQMYGACERQISGPVHGYNGCLHQNLPLVAPRHEHGKCLLDSRSGISRLHRLGTGESSGKWLSIPAVRSSHRLPFFLLFSTAQPPTKYDETEWRSNVLEVMKCQCDKQ